MPPVRGHREPATAPVHRPPPRRVPNDPPRDRREAAKLGGVPELAEEPLAPLRRRRAAICATFSKRMWRPCDAIASPPRRRCMDSPHVELPTTPRASAERRPSRAIAPAVMHCTSGGAFTPAARCNHKGLARACDLPPSWGRLHETAFRARVYRDEEGTGGGFWALTLGKERAINGRTSRTGSGQGRQGPGSAYPGAVVYGVHGCLDRRAPRHLGQDGLAPGEAAGRTCRHGMSTIGPCSSRAPFPRSRARGPPPRPDAGADRQDGDGQAAEPGRPAGEGGADRQARGIPRGGGAPHGARHGGAEARGAHSGHARRRGGPIDPARGEVPRAACTSSGRGLARTTRAALIAPVLTLRSWPLSEKRRVSVSLPSCPGHPCFSVATFAAIIARWLSSTAAA